MSVIVNIDVPDLATGEAFYCEGLGFRTVRRLFDGAVAQVERDGFTAFLIAAPSGSIAIASMQNAASNELLRNGNAWLASCSTNSTRSPSPCFCARAVAAAMACALLSIPTSEQPV